MARLHVPIVDDIYLNKVSYIARYYLTKINNYEKSNDSIIVCNSNRMQ